MSKKIAKTQLIAALPVAEKRPQTSSVQIEDEFHKNVILSGVEVNLEFIQQHSESKADIDFGAEIVELELSIPEKEARKKVLETRLKKVNDKLDGEPAEVKVSSIQSENKEVIRFKNWKFGDQAGMVAIMVGLLAMLIVSAVNVYSTLVASEPVFIENPALAVMISLLAPAGSLALKFLSSIFDQYRHKKRFTVFVYVLTTLCFLAWVSLFAGAHSGVAGGIDWESIGEPNNTGSILTLLQMFSEVLIAASLALAAQDIYLRYHSPTLDKNPVYQSLERHHASILTEYDKVCADLIQLKARLIVLQAKRNTVVDLDLSRLAALRAKRARIAAANDF